ncbi:hypothetical protein TNCV_3812621 [Trichonephila clavipes]|nr:hypothetical protein TNCV_3812621 [Trichonephila clavipes]
MPTHAFSLASSVFSFVVGSQLAQCLYAPLPMESTIMVIRPTDQAVLGVHLQHLYHYWKHTMTLNPFSATIEGKGDYRDASRRNAFPPTYRLKPKIDVSTSCSHDNTGLAIETFPTAHAFAELDSCVDITSHDRRHPAANVLRTYIG